MQPSTTSLTDGSDFRFRRWACASSVRTTPGLSKPPGSKARFTSRITATAGDRSWIRHVNGSPSYLGTSELSAHFGLGDAQTVDRLSVRWPDGRVTVLHDVEANQLLRIPDTLP